MAAITPTPRAGTWLVVLPGTDGSDLGVGTWLRIDAVDFRRPGGWSVGMIQW